MNIQKLLYVVVVLTCVGCAKASTSDSNASVVGQNLTGTYLLKGVDCYNSTLTTLLYSGTFTGVYTDTITMNGNAMTEALVSGTCHVSLSANVIFNSGRYALSDFTSTTLSSCTANRAVSDVNINVSPSAVVFPSGTASISYTVGDYFVNGNDVGIGSDVYTTSTYTDKCFVVYTKQ